MERVTPRSIPRALGAVALVAAFVLSGCSATTARTTGTNDGEGVIGVSLPAVDDRSWERLGDALGEELRARGYRVDLQYAAGDGRTQFAQAQNMLTKGEDAIVLVPLSTDTLARARTAAVDAGVPLIAAGRDLDGAGAVEAVDPAALGRAQAQALLDAIADAPEPTDVAVFAGSRDDPDATTRHAAALEVLESAEASGAVRIVAGADAQSAAVADAPAEVESASEERARTVLAPSDDTTVGAVLALGDAVTRGVVAALTTPDPRETASPSPTASPEPTEPAERDITPAPRVPPVVVGSGGDAPTVRALRDGVVSATVFVDTREWAVPLADAVEEALAGDPPPDSVAPQPLTVERNAVEAVFLDSAWVRVEDLAD
jgi:putative multiple sugar transport system substrate-binding protein